MRQSATRMLVVSALLCSIQLATAQWQIPSTGCSIRYDYDGGGNRTSRYWYCWDQHVPPPRLGAFADSSGGNEKALRPLEELTLQLAPNPTSDQLTVHLSASIDQCTFDVYDAQGRSAMHGTLQGDTKVIDVSALRPGLYNFCLVRGAEMMVRGFIVE